MNDAIEIQETHNYMYNLAMQFFGFFEKSEDHRQLYHSLFGKYSEYYKVSKFTMFGLTSISVAIID